MKKNVFLQLLLVCSLFGQSQKIVPFKNDNGLWGYKDEYFDEIVIQPKYNSADEFSEGLAVISIFSITKLHRFGFIDKTGKEILPVKYLQAGRFSSGLAPVKTEAGLIVFIDRTGKEVLKTNYTDARSFSNGLAAVSRNKKTGFINQQGQEVVPLIYEAANDFVDECTLAMIDNMTVQIDRSGKELPLISQYGYVDRARQKLVIEPNVFTSGNGFSADGLAVVSSNRNGLSGAINKNGSFVFPLKYGKIRRLDNGLYAFSENSKYGIADKTGRILISSRFKSVHSISGLLAMAVNSNNQFIIIDKEGRETTAPLTEFSEFTGDLATVWIDRQYGAINTSGKLVIPIRYDYVSILNQGVAKVSRNGKVGLFDADGKQLTEIKYDEINSYEDGLSRVFIRVGQFGDSYGFVDRTGKEVIPLIYNKAESFSDGLGLICKDYKWGVVNRGGRIKVAPKYDQLHPFSEGLFAAKLSNKWGFIDSSGKTILPFTFAEASSFKNGLAIVSQSGKYGFINRKGQYLFPGKLEGVRHYTGNYAAARLQGKWGFIDRKGNFIIQPQFDEVEDMQEGKLIVRLNEKWGVMDINGKYLLQPIYERLDDISGNIIAVRLDGKWGYVNLQGKTLVVPAYSQAKPFSEGLAAVSYYDMGGLFFIDSTGKRIIDGPFRNAYRFKNGVVYVVTQNMRQIFIDKKGIEQEKYAKNIQGENTFVVFKSGSGSNPSGKTPNFIPTPADKRLSNSFTKFYRYTKLSGYEDYMSSDYKVVVSGDYIQVFIGGKNNLYSLWAEYRVIASDNFSQPGQMQGPVYLSDNNKLLFFFSDQGRDFLRIASKENGAYTEYVSDRR